ncbi:MAG: hypothetical protein P4L56_20605 [Candidatus Sulfopaludibacter sp.]|nr:hypothetical protein [Candidatus Sulfopaludibacter sp.]
MHGKRFLNHIAVQPVRQAAGNSRREHRLLRTPPVICLPNFTSGFYSTSLMTLKRIMDVRRQVILEMGT